MIKTFFKKTWGYIVVFFVGVIGVAGLLITAFNKYDEFKQGKKEDLINETEDKIKTQKEDIKNEKDIIDNAKSTLNKLSNGKL